MLLSGWEGAPEEEAGGDAAGVGNIGGVTQRQDYLVVVFDNEFDWRVACDKLGITAVAGAGNETSTMKQRGLGRVVPAARLLALLDQ